MADQADVGAPAIAPMRIDQVIKLAMSDGEWLGRHGTGLTAQEFHDVKNRAYVLRVNQVNAILAELADGGDDE